MKDGKVHLNFSIKTGDYCIYIYIICNIILFTYLHLSHVSSCVCNLFVGLNAHSSFIGRCVGIGWFQEMPLLPVAGSFGSDLT